MDARSVMEEARDWSPKFSRERIGEGPALRKLARIQEDLYARAVALNPDALAVTAPEVVAYATITTALDARTPVDVPAFLTPVRAEFRFTEDGDVSPVAVVTLKVASNRSCPFPAVIALEAKLRFVDLRDFGAQKSGWDEEGQLEWYYVPRPTSPTVPEDTLSAPYWMRSKVGASLATWMAAQAGVMPPGLSDEAKAAEEGFVQTVLAQQGGSSWYVHQGA